MIKNEVYFSLFVLLLFLLNESIFAQFNWEQIQGPYGGNVDEIAFHQNGNIYVATSNGLYKSSDGGNYWEKIDLGTDVQSVFQIFIHPSGRMLVSGYYYDFFISDTTVSNWRVVNKEIEDISMNSEGRLYGISINGNLLSSDNVGETWELVSSLHTFICTYYLYDDNIFFATSSEGVYRSNDSGLSWVFTPLEFNITTKFASDSKENIYLATWSGLFISKNLGESWNKAIFPPEYGSRMNTRGILITEDDKIFLGTNHGIIYSEDYCENWIMHCSDFTNVHYFCEGPDGEFLATDFPKGVLRYNPQFGKWNIISNGINANNVSFLKNVNDKLFCQSYTGIYYLDRIDGVWDTVQFGRYYEFMDVDNTERVFTVESNKINYSIDLGSNWETIQIDEDWGKITSVIVLPNNTILAYTGFKRIIRSTDFGNSWTEVWYKEGFYRQINFYSHLNDLYFSYMCDLYKSTDSGETWQKESVFAKDIRTLAFSPWGNMYVGTFDCLYVSSFENEWKWVNVTNGPLMVKCIKFSDDGSMFVMDDYIYASSDRGKSWQPVSDKLEYTGGWILEIFQNNLVFGTGLRGLYSTEINITATEMPLNFSLSQNYPNPFNSSTRIEFYLTEPHRVNLKIYNSLGEEVKDYIPKYLTEGSYQVWWKPGALPSGVYFYQLSYGDNSVTKKMIYLK